LFKLEKKNLAQAKDTGLAIVLILLLVALIWEQHQLILPAAIVLVLAMAWPALFRPLAHVWFGLSFLLGSIVSKILLTVVYALIAVPVGLIRRLGGADAMRLKQWKKGSGSVFVERNHAFTAGDLEKPY
jgi:hypothetical protein